MHIETRKLHLIQEMLKVKSETTLSALESLLKIGNKKKVENKTDLKKFSGIWSDDEAEEIESIIAKSCETIHPDDWK